MFKQRNKINIPTVTHLVAAGDPRKKFKAKQQQKTTHSKLDELNQRIDEIENAIGQDNTGPVGRAFAIRKESNKTTKVRPPFLSDAELQKVR